MRFALIAREIEIVRLIGVAFRSWQHDRAPRMAAALAYYIALSLTPIVSVLLSLARRVTGSGAAVSQVLPQIRSLVGSEGSGAVRVMLEGVRHSPHGIVATVLGLATVFFAASAAVSELRDAMNTIWKIPADAVSGIKGGVSGRLKARAISLALVAGASLSLVLLLILNSWLLAAGSYVTSGAAVPAAVTWLVESAVTLIGTTVVFAFVFKVLPHVPLLWGDVAGGAAGTALLFMAGKSVLGFYLGNAGFANTYGGAGSLIILLVWVCYSAQILFLGAEFTRAYAHRFGSMHASVNVHLDL